MVERRINCLPESAQGIVVGILTGTDLLAQLTTLLGWLRGVRVTARVPDRQGQFGKITSASASQSWEINTAVIVLSVPAFENI
jgi:hypothetical protein